MTRYKPRMEGRTASATEPDNCVGAFVTDVREAQLLHTAGLPYWLMRPTWCFKSDNILSIVKLLDPSSALEMEADPHSPQIDAPSTVAAKLAALATITTARPWYRDPFDGPASESAGSSVGASSATQKGESSRSQRGTDSSRQIPNDPKPKRAHPYSSPTSKPTSTSKAATNVKSGRDKFARLDRPEMPSSIPAWEDALVAVDRTRPVSPHNFKDSRYLFPEPALLASAEDSMARQVALHHYTIIEPVLLYRLGISDDPHTPLSSQQWRDVLFGKVWPQDAKGSKSAQRANFIDEILGPAMRACGLSQLHDFPVKRESLVPFALSRAKEIIWKVAELEFRFEFVSLDRRASTLSRPQECAKCFPGGFLMGVPLTAGKEGLAAATPEERYPFVCAMARLMRDWLPRPPSIIFHADPRRELTTQEQRDLERAVAAHYCQTFYESFGRAAVIPMRLEHELGD
ncbi:hypothetical protein R3P38DRAFT_3235271 [Favolaschia claudopus]|uniref:Uncharacterized protein n=1 Tax=Favolaschia claudopus TaxID=2862362 RepID=A0AAV9ZF67_9AGAR